MVTLAYALTIIFSTCFGMRPIGPEHERIATSCIYDIINRYFTANSLILLLSEDDAETPGYEIETHVLKAIHKNLSWLIQVTDGGINSFNSSKQCYGSGEQTVCRNYFQLLKKVDYYLIITDDAEKLRVGLINLSKMLSYETRAVFLVYFFKISKNSKATAEELLMVLYKHSNYRAIVLVPNTNASLILYGLELFGENTEKCAESPEIYIINECKNGHFLDEDFKIKTYYNNNFRNCSIQVVAMKMPPFVINKDQGLEIRILKEFTRRLNVTFEFDVSEVAEHWGEKTNGTWSGPLKTIYDNSFNLGVGGIASTKDRNMDFDFSDTYYTEKMVWIVPSALPIPQYRVIIIIFTYSLWLCLLVILVIYAFLIFTASNLTVGEYNFLKMFGAGMIMSVQLMISSSAVNQPSSRVVRILFLSLALFNIIISCCYQSSLIDVLTNTRYGHQIETEEEVLNSGLGIGGLEAYKSIFNDTDDPNAMKVYNMYEVYAKENDSMLLWLKTVAQDRDTITVLGSLYVHYLKAKNIRMITNDDLSSKIYIVPKVLFGYSIRLVYSKGFPMQKPFNRVIQGLIHSGLIIKWRNDYFKDTEKEIVDVNDTISEDEEEIKAYHHEGVIVITLEHMQGAFALILLGNAVGFVFFLLEITVCYINRSACYRNMCYKLRRIRFKQVKKKEAVKRQQGMVVKKKEVVIKLRNLNNFEFIL